ncbi:hypothetical protein DBA29_17170 [Xenophilus aerolatus]|nr:hypothetical protein [Xenophilus aerolatus]
MRDVFVVTTLQWLGERVLGAQVGEADPTSNTWKTPPRSYDPEQLMDLIERPNTLVTSKTRSGTQGPNLMVRTDASGARTIQAIPVPGVYQRLEDQIGNIPK